MERRDYNFARRLTLQCGVTPIPPTAFYSEAHQHLGSDMARFAFCKTDEDLALAADRLLRMQEGLAKKE